MKKNVGFDRTMFFDVAWEFFLWKARVDLHKAVNIGFAVPKMSCRMKRHK